MVPWYLERVRLAVPAGPIVVGGHSLGGVLALEVARALGAEGYVVEAVVLLDTQRHARRGRWFGAIRVRARYRAWRIRRRLGLRSRSDRRRDTARATPLRDLLDDQRMAANLASWNYRGRPYSGRVIYIEATDSGPSERQKPGPGAWALLVPAMEVRRVPGCHTGRGSFLSEPFVAVTAAAVNDALDSPAG